MVKVNFYDHIEDSLLKFAVIVSKSDGKWVFCKHRERTTYECPGGHRELNEDIVTTARRELYEETGAVTYTLEEVCVYSFFDGITESFGMLFYADITEFGQLPESEIERVELFEQLPDKWTYPNIQPMLLGKIESFIKSKDFANNIEIKDNIIPDISDLIDLYKDAGWSNYTNNIDMLKLAYDNSLRVVSLWDNNKLIGIIRVVGDGHSIIYIQDLIILTKYQKQGREYPKVCVNLQTDVK
ncbi:NUDIX hydrolase [Anaerocolumna sp.]|uniref:NUDIX hydrolase n=1 Tax=Anaerocolumna sp. TaxID=2041569 RepID=UPI0028ADE295|nr:NUDIX domain-containing protein [Anaerocolumna sp.]